MFISRAEKELMWDRIGVIDKQYRNIKALAKNKRDPTGLTASEYFCQFLDARIKCAIDSHVAADHPEVTEIKNADEYTWKQQIAAMRAENV